MKKQDNIVVCDCGNPAHSVWFLHYADEDEEDVHNTDLCMSVHLAPQKNFFLRIWNAIKYVFGHNARFGQFEEIIFNDQEKLQQIIDFCNKVIDNKNQRRKQYQNKQKGVQ